jgi:hypothetical protein
MVLGILNDGMSNSNADNIWFDSDVSSIAGDAQAQQSAEARCSICSLEQASCICLQCNTASCCDCFAAMHAHPSRRQHRMVPIPETDKKKSKAASPAKPGTTGKNRKAAAVHNNTSQVQHAPSNVGPMDDKRSAEKSRQSVTRGDLPTENGVHMTASDGEENDGSQKEAKAARAAARRAQFLLKTGERDAIEDEPFVCMCAVCTSEASEYGNVCVYALAC